MATRFKRCIFSGELVSEEYEPSPYGRSIIARETPKYGAAARCRQPAVRDDRKHVSKSLGIHPKQAKKFNQELKSFGVTTAHYSEKTGFLESTSREGKAAAWAIRGCYDREAGSVEQKYASAIGF